MDIKEKQFKDGFNSGYFLAEHDPELARVILDAAWSTNEPGEYAYGLSNGHDTYVVEKNIAQNKEELGEAKTEPAKSELPKEKLGDNYQKGFNSGYFLSKYEPEIAEKLFSTNLNHSEYCSGMSEGKQQHEMEKIQDRLKEISKNKPTKDDKDLDKDR